MKIISFRRNAYLTAVVLAAISIGGVMPAFGQDLVPVGGLGGGSSVFVFRGGAKGGGSKKFTSSRAVRTKAQRMETAKKVKKQYDTQAKADPRRIKSVVVAPDKVPANIKTMSKENASKLFAGVAEYYVEKNDTENSINFFRESLGLDANNLKAKQGLGDALATKATVLLFDEQTAKAKAYFLEALKYDPRNASAYFGLGEAYTELDQRDEAIANYEKALSGDPSLTEIYLPLGVLYFQKGEIAKADDLLSKATTTSGDTAETEVLIGQIRISQNRNDDALTAFKRAKAFDPGNAEANYFTGVVLMRLGNPTDALTEFQKAIALRPTYFEAFRESGQAYMELKKYAEAVTALKSAVRQKNDNAETFVALGEANRLAGNYNDAESAYATAKDLLMRNKDFNKDEVADLYSKIGYSIGRQCELNMRQAIACRWPFAITAFQKATDLTGSPIDRANLGWAYYNAARVEINSRRPEAARPSLELAKSELQRALTGGPTIADGVLQNLGGVQIDLGDFAGAVESLKQVVAHKPDWTFSKYALGTAYFKLNDFQNAERMFNAALDDDPQNVSYLTSLGYAEIKLRNVKEAKKVIAKLKKLDSDQAVNLETEMKFAGLK